MDVLSLPRAKELLAEQARMKGIFDSNPILGERFSVPRAGKDPVDVILHRPRSAKAPLFLCLHGGGFTGLDAVCIESFCHMLSEQLGYFVVNVNYKLSPGVAFPYAIEEGYDCARYFSDRAGEYGVDDLRIGVGGFSAGGSLSAGIALKAKEEGLRLSCQMLVYPVTDMTVPAGAEEAMVIRRRMYCQNGDNQHRWASPVLAADEELAGVCPCVMITCGIDKLRPQGEEYANRLIRIGVPVSVRRYENALHGFIEVNRPDFIREDPRRTPEQDSLCRDAEEYILGQLPVYMKG